ncbi:hypothetical protein [Chitinophaga eiseniae]|uniref:Lipoprotein n=1 Tax=Chitinophaga eiseniae TaxID=634771 RepID=A0A847SWH8_9BACT|nr:hypothetical protein [Chitinophaga eiseniae]NLR82766.1 hypothetical protein [Chitinophaga eiseniae]
MKPIHLVACLLTAVACNNPKSTTRADEAPGKRSDSTIVATPVTDTARFVFLSNLRNGDTLIKGKTYIDTLSFINYNENGDDGLFVCARNRDTAFLIFNTNNPPELNNGDQVLVQWNMDVYEPAGDPENPLPREFVVDYRLLHPGKVTLLKSKKPALEAIYRQKDLSDTGKQEIDAAVWYYVANTTDTSIRRMIDTDPQLLQYTVEEETEDSRLSGVFPITFTDGTQQVLKRVFFDVERPYSLFE